MKILPILAAALCGAAAASEMSLTGTSEKADEKFTETFAVKPFTPYKVSFEARRANRETIGRYLCSGLPGLNVDHDPSRNWDWSRFTDIVATPSGEGGPVETPIRFSLFQTYGEVLVRDWSVTEQKALHATDGTLTLGDGEALLGTRYYFNDRPRSHHHNHSRPLWLWRGNVSLNGNRYPFGEGGEIAWRHEVGGRRLLSGAVSFDYKRFDDGVVSVSVSSNGLEWTEIGRSTVDNPNPEIAIPQGFFPAGEIFVRLKCEAGVKSGGQHLQLGEYVFDGEVDGEPAYLEGSTLYVDAGEDAEPPALGPPEYYRCDYGELLPESDGALALWRASPGWKIPRNRPLPSGHADGLCVALAANETEAVQLVLTPSEGASDVTVAAEVPGLECEALRVAYVTVEKTVDIGVPGLYPDPLPPQSAPLAIGAGENQPFWIRVKAPKGTPKGTYRGWVEVRGEIAGAGGGPEKFARRVPLTVEVFGFELPDKMECRSLFGFWYTFEDRYHGAKTREDRLRVYDNYMRKFAEYHISPSAGPTYGLRDWWRNPKWEGDEPVFDWREWDEGMARGFDEFGFNAMRIPRRGLGIGSGLGPDDPDRELGGVKKGDPRHEIRLANLLKCVQDHLEEKGWLDRIYFYLYDEPQEKDFPELMETYAKLAKYAPKLRRFVTLNIPPVPVLAGGPQVWCPTPDAMDSSFARELRDGGDEFWLYLCCNPREPYVTLFIDHPGVEMRTWLWQAWAEKAKGVLMWSTEQWTNKAKYPDPDYPQNPYVDGQTWCGGKFPRRSFGCGDGRLFYPPESVFEDVSAWRTKLNPGPNFDDPVGSVRGEMLRDGIEDYEYFAILRRLDPANPLLAVPADVSKSLTDFSKSPAGIEAHRLKLAREIERLSSGGQPRTR